MGVTKISQHKLLNKFVMNLCFQFACQAKRKDTSLSTQSDDLDLY